MRARRRAHAAQWRTRLCAVVASILTVAGSVVGISAEEGLAAGGAAHLVSSSAPTTCGVPTLVAGQPAAAVVLLDGAPSHEEAGTFYPVSVANADPSVPTVPSYCPLNSSGQEQSFPAGLNQNLRRWSEFSVPDGDPKTVTKACQRSGGFNKGTCLVAELAKDGAVLLPYSYTGATLQPDGRFVMAAYGSGDTKQSLANSVNNLDTELRSIRATWPKTALVVVGHSYGGLVAEQWWDTNQSSQDPLAVAHVFSLDSPINGVMHCALAKIPYGDAATTFCSRWNNRASRGASIVQLDSDHTYTAVGAPHDPTYETFTWFPGGGGGLEDQVVLTCEIGVLHNDDPHSSCIAKSVSHISSDPNCDGDKGEIQGTTHHDLVKVCPDVVKLISSTVRSAAGTPPSNNSTGSSATVTPHTSTLLSLAGFSYEVAVVQAKKDPNGVASTDTVGEPTLQPAPPGSTYAIVRLRIHNLQRDRAAPLPDPSQFPIGIAALRSDLPGAVSTGPSGSTGSTGSFSFGGTSSVCYSGPGQTEFFTGDDTSECDQIAIAVVSGGAPESSQSIPAGQSVDVIAYFAIPQSPSLSIYRIVAEPSVTLSDAEYQAGAKL